MPFQDSINNTAVTETYLDEENKQSVMKYATAANRTADAALAAALREGMHSYQDDTNSDYVYNGAGVWSTVGPVHGARTVWIPSFTQTSNITKTVLAGNSYSRVGRQVSGNCAIAATQAGTLNGLITVTLPFTAANTDGTAIGAGYLNRVTAGFIQPFVAVVGGSGTLVFFIATNVGAVSETNSRLGSGSSFLFNVASGDTVTFLFGYEAAADA